MAYVTGLLKEEKTVFYVETKGVWEVPGAEALLLKKGCEPATVTLWAVPPTFDNEHFVKIYPHDVAWEIRPI